MCDKLDLPTIGIWAGEYAGRKEEQTGDTLRVSS